VWYRRRANRPVEFVRVEDDIEQAVEGILGSELPDEFADQLKARGTLKTGDDMLVCQSQTPGGRGDATTPGPGPSPTLPEPFSESSTKPLAATTVHSTTATRARSSVESKYTCGSWRLHDRAGSRHARRWMS
jgi:hypothetical protein